MTSQQKSDFYRLAGDDKDNYNLWAYKLFHKNATIDTKGFASVTKTDESFTINNPDGTPYQTIDNIKISKFSTRSFSKNEDYVGIMIYDFGDYPFKRDIQNDLDYGK